MIVVVTPYVLVSIFAAIMPLIVATVAWQRRSAPGGQPLFGLMIAVSIWSAGAAIEYATIGIEGKVLWAKVQYLGVVSTPVFFLLLAVGYSRLDHWLTPRRVALLLVVPTITLLLAITNDWHGLIWPSVTPIDAPEANLALYEHGPGFWLGSVGYAYLLMAVGTGLLLRATYRFPSFYRRQALMLVTAALAPWLVNIIYVAGLSPLPGLEMTPLVMVITGAIITWNLLHLRLLDLTPVARDTLVETMAAGMIVLDTQDRVVDINPAARHISGVDAAMQLGQPASELFAAWSQWLASADATQTIQVEYAPPDEGGRTFDVIVAPIRDRRGFWLGRLVILHDITERKNAQRAIEQLNSELEERVARRTHDLATSEERFRQVVTSISDHVFALCVPADGEVTVLYSSPRFRELTGFTRADLGGSFLSTVQRITHPEDHAAVVAFFHRLLESDDAELEYRWIHGDGAITWVRTSARVQPQNGARIIYGVTSDITERKRMEQIDAEMRALDELDRLRSELVSNVSHELRTPLGLIKAASTTLQRRDVSFSEETQQRLLQGITDEADRLEHLVANLLDIAHLDQNRFFLNLEPTDLNQLVAAIVDAERNKLHQTADVTHKLVADLPRTPVIAEVDAARIEQVVRNLLENAIRYSPAGGVITVGVKRNEQLCELIVADRGIGIAPEDQPQIFERFYRARDPRVQPIRGTGLGLSICREIVRAHNGEICVDSVLDRETVFTVRLPLKAPDGKGDKP